MRKRKNPKEMKLRKELVMRSRGENMERGTFPKSGRFEDKRASVNYRSKEKDKMPGPGAYELRSRRGMVKKATAKTFGHKKDVLEDMRTTDSFFKKNGELKGIEQAQKRNPRGPSATSYDPSFNQIWPKSSRYMYREPVAKTHSRKQKADKLLQKKIAKYMKKELEFQKRRSEALREKSKPKSKREKSVSFEDSLSTLERDHISPEKKSMQSETKAGTFGTAPKFGFLNKDKSKIETIPTPGPADYYVDQETIAKRVEMDIGAGARLLGKLKYLLDNGVPGPGTYSKLDLNVVRKTDKGYKMSMADRGIMIDGYEGSIPGPGHYNLTYFPKKRATSLRASPDTRRMKKARYSSQITSMDRQILKIGALSQDNNLRNTDSYNQKMNKRRRKINVRAKRYRMGAGISFTKAKKKTAVGIDKKRKRVKRQDNLDRSEIVIPTQNQEEVESVDEIPGPNKYNVGKVYDRLHKVQGRSFLGKKGHYLDDQFKLKKGFPGPGNYKITRDMDMDDDDSTKFLKSRVILGNKLNFENGLNEESAGNIDMTVFNNIQENGLVDIDMVAEQRKKKIEEEKRATEEKIKALASFLKNRESPKQVKEKQDPFDIMDGEDSSPPRRSKFSTSQIMHMKAHSYVNSQKRNRIRSLTKRRRKLRQGGASFGKSTRPCLKRQKKKVPGPADYNLRKSLGNGCAVNWGKPKNYDIENLSKKIYQEFGDVGPCTYDLKPTFPQVQDWERWKLENKNY